MQQPQALGRTRQEFQAGGVVEVNTIDDDRPVAIDERDPRARAVAVAAHGRPVATRCTVPEVLCPGTIGASMSLPPRAVT